MNILDVYEKFQCILNKNCKNLLKRNNFIFEESLKINSVKVMLCIENFLMNFINYKYNNFVYICEEYLINNVFEQFN